MRKMAVMAVTWSAALGASTFGAAALATSVAYADTTPVPSSSSSTCGALPTWVQGMPAHLKAGAATGDYLWHDSNGWHLRVTHATKHQKVFTGTITATSPITFARVRDERHDKTTLSADKKKLTFRFVNYGGIDGVDFGDACATSTHFAFAIDGHKASRNQIYIGRHSSRPGTNPFTITRRSSATAA